MRKMQITLASLDRDYVDRKNEETYVVHVHMSPSDVGTEDGARKIIDQANRGGAQIPMSDKMIDQVKGLRPGQTITFGID